MGVYDDSVAAASATVGTDLFSGKDYAQKPNLRAIKGLGVVGGNAINEAKVELVVGGVSFGTLLNTKAGVSAVQKEDVRDYDIGALPNERVQLIVRVAPTVSPIVWQMITEDM